MKKLTVDNLEELAIGSAILGSGGGDDHKVSLKMTKYEMEKNKNPLYLINYDELKSEDLIVPLGFMGAPSTEVEKIPSGREFSFLFENIEKKLGKKVSGVMPFEIGGRNAFTPLMVAAQLGLPVLDADMMGRAFPEFKMNACALAKMDQSTAFLGDSLGNTVCIHAKNRHPLEKIGNLINIAIGSFCAFCLYPISKSQVLTGTIHKSLSKAISIGYIHKKSIENKEVPLEAMLDFCKGVLLGSGKIFDIDRSNSNNSQNGSVVIQDKNGRLELLFKNEYLLAKLNGKIIATTPDILMLLEKETGIPVSEESLQFGLDVDLISLPAPKIWTSEAGLALVGPRAFGYNVDYHPINRGKRSYAKETF